MHLSLIDVSAGYRVVASLGDGRRYLHHHVFPTQEAAGRFLDRLVQRLPSVRPEGSPHWEEVEPVYGSPEYQRLGCEAAEAQREREDDLARM